jgi:hypothetical protein
MKASISEKVKLNNAIRCAGEMSGKETLIARQTALKNWADSKIPYLVSKFFEAERVDTSILDDLCKLHWNGLGFYQLKTGVFRVADDAHRKSLLDLAHHISRENAKTYSTMSDECHDAFVDMILTFLVGSDFDSPLGQLISRQLRSEKQEKDSQRKEILQNLVETRVCVEQVGPEYHEEEPLVISRVEGIYQEIKSHISGFGKKDKK